ncbi:MAG TPA: hypothetical protein VGZ73_19925 [Bryobacteraceae bacterium]|jgi:hypothetical protein|nr:hypothetical protein [Bryobacteraceae bacterium]
MTTNIRKLVFCGLAVVAVLGAADATYVGKWKMNSAKSDFGETSITFAQAPSGGMQMTVDGQTYTFKTDGKDYDGMFGSKMAWKAIDANTWEATNKMGAKVLSVDTYKLSADGKTLSGASKGTSPAGAPFENSVTYQRVSGTSGLAGKWKTKNLKQSSPDIIEFIASGADGLSFKMPDQKLVCDAKVDGKSYPCTGPDLPPNTSVVFKKGGANSVSADITIGGRLAYQSTYAGSTDGKTLTETGGAVGTTEKYKAVYDRQ